MAGELGKRAFGVVQTQWDFAPSSFFPKDQEDFEGVGVQHNPWLGTLKSWRVSAFSSASSLMLLLRGHCLGGRRGRLALMLSQLRPGDSQDAELERLGRKCHMAWCDFCAAVKCSVKSFYSCGCIGSASHDGGRSAGLRSKGSLTFPVNEQPWPHPGAAFAHSHSPESHQLK